MIFVVAVLLVDAIVIDDELVHADAADESSCLMEVDNMMGEAEEVHSCSC